MKVKLLFLIIFSTLVACNSKNPVVKKHSKIKLFGDSLKIEYTYSGDTVFQKRTDLKNNSNKKLDNTYDVVSIWTTKALEQIDCNKKIAIVKDELTYSFCLSEVLNQTQKQIDNRTEIKWSKDSITAFKRELILFRKGEIATVSNNNYYMLYHFVKNLEVEISNHLTKSKVSKIRIEHYETNFSGGHIYYLINKDNDTIKKYNLSDWTK